MKLHFGCCDTKKENAEVQAKAGCEADREVAAEMQRKAFKNIQSTGIYEWLDRWAEKEQGVKVSRKNSWVNGSERYRIGREKAWGTE